MLINGDNNSRRVSNYTEGPINQQRLSSDNNSHIYASGAKFWGGIDHGSHSKMTGGIIVNDFTSSNSHSPHR
jgi:hypothetical protein